jgi:integrase
MASFHKLPSGLWRAQVARNGVRKSATRETKAAAQAWAMETEAELIAMKRGDLPRKTVEQALQRYKEEVSPKKRGERWEALRLDSYMREPWAQRWLTELQPADIARWREKRLREVTLGSVQRDFNLLKAVFSVARKEWQWLDKDPMEGVASPGGNKERSRRIQWHEIRALCRALGYGGETKSAEVALAFLIALRTGMRAGEILSLTPAAVNLKTRVAHLKNTKNGDDRDVPMTRAAARLFKGWSGWTVSSRSLDALFRKAKGRCKIKDLHFHDSRAEALTRLARRVDVLTLAKISGHRDVNLLSRVYYRETASQIAQRLG